MKPLVTLVAIAGCNQTFGLYDVTLRDAPPDAPSTCPPPGDLPHYASPSQFMTEYCTQYERDAAGNVAIANCYNGVTSALVTGPVDGPLDIVVSADFAAHLDPDGSAMYAKDDASEIVRYHRDGTTFVVDGIVTDLGMIFGATSTLARSGDELRMLVMSQADLELQEWSGHGASWTKVGAPYPIATFGLATILGIALGADGLRMIATVATGIDNHLEMAYFDRASLDDRFLGWHPIALPVVTDAFITADCTQVYYSGLERIFVSTRTR